MRIPPEIIEWNHLVVRSEINRKNYVIGTRGKTNQHLNLKQNVIKNIKSYFPTK